MSSFPDGKNPFSDEVNPYAPPTTPSQVTQPTAETGAWRQGNLLVVHRQWAMPRFCVRTNLPTEMTIQRTVYWLHPLVYLAVISPLIFIILALILRKQMILDIPVDHEFQDRQRRKMLIGGVCGVLGVLLLFGGFALAANVDGDAIFAAVAVIGLGIVLGLGGLLMANFAYNPLVAKKIKDDYAWLRGAHPDYLERLPPWPYA